MGYAKVRRLTKYEIETVLEWLEISGLEATACKKAGINLASFRNERDNNADFDAQVSDTIAYFSDFAEKEAFRRAFHGVKRGVWYKGDRVGEELEYSDTLAITILKALRPDKYKDRKEVTGKDGGKLEVVIQDFSKTDTSNNVRSRIGQSTQREEKAEKQLKVGTAVVDATIEQMGIDPDDLI